MSVVEGWGWGEKGENWVERGKGGEGWGERGSVGRGVSGEFGWLGLVMGLQSGKGLRLQKG